MKTRVRVRCTLDVMVDGNFATSEMLDTVISRATYKAKGLINKALATEPEAIKNITWAHEPVIELIVVPEGAIEK